MKNIFNYLLPAVLLLPAIAAAQEGFGQVDDFVNDGSVFINNTLIPILLAVSFLIFLWGLVQFFLVAGDDNTDAKKKGKNLMIWGVFAFVIIVSIWGLVALIAGGLNFQNTDSLETRPYTPNSNR